MVDRYLPVLGKLTGVLLVSTLSAACGLQSPPRLDGVTSMAAWKVENVTYQHDLARGKWRYVLRLKDLTGSGLHLTKLGTRYSGIEFQHWTPGSADIDVRIPPNAEVTFPCGRVVTPASGGTMRNWHLTEYRTYSGTDGRGQPVMLTVTLPFGDVDAPAVAPVLDFARFVSFNGGSMTLQCEALTRETPAFDPARQEAPYFIVGVDNVQRQVPMKTRWINPAGEEVRVVESTVRADSPGRNTLFVHVTHSIPGPFVSARPGTWKVELFLDGKLQGTYSLDVPSRAATRD
jgi:hypothetical protein